MSEKDMETTESREKELSPHITYIRDYNKMINLPDAEYKKELSIIKESAIDHLKQQDTCIVPDNFAQVINDIMTGKKGLSYSAISQFLKSPKHFKRYKSDKKEVTKAMEEGKRFHMACLQPELFEQKYWVLDDSVKCLEIGGAKPRATKAYKEWVAEESANHTGEMLGHEEYDTYMSMSEALRQNNSSKKFMLNLTSTEELKQTTWDDYLINYVTDGKGTNEDGDFIIDLKKAADASFKRIKWDIRDMNYDMQGGMYTEFEGIKRYILIYIDKSCNITVVNLMPETLEEGFNKFEMALEKFQECAELDIWNASYDFWNNGHINF